MDGKQLVDARAHAMRVYRTARAEASSPTTDAAIEEAAPPNNNARARAMRQTAYDVEATEAVVVPQALTPADCDALISMGGRISEGRGFAHMVLYLHQQRRLERTNPALWAKLLGIMREHGPAVPPTDEEAATRAVAEAGGTADDRGAATAAAVVAERAGLNVRCAELHTYAEGGGLADAGHRDKGSTLTMSVLLSHFSPDRESMRDPGGHTGGQFVTWSEGEAVVHSMDRGDAIIFCSEKLHNVALVTGGVRKCLVIELWSQATNTTGRFGQ